MGCYNMSRRLDELRRCGCRACEEEYYEMRRREERRYYDAPPKFLTAGFIETRNPILATAVDYKKETKVEEPKNIAVKMLVDKLKVEQSALKGHQEVLTNYAKTVKEYNTKKLAAQKNIKELAAALKKLGHKETAQ